MSVLPKALIRIEDGELFTLNEDGSTYTMFKSQLANPLKYTYEELMSSGEFLASYIKDMYDLAKVVHLERLEEINNSDDKQD